MKEILRKTLIGAAIWDVSRRLWGCAARRNRKGIKIDYDNPNFIDLTNTRSKINPNDPSHYDKLTGRVFINFRDGIKPTSSSVISLMGVDVPVNEIFEGRIFDIEQAEIGYGFFNWQEHIRYGLLAKGYVIN